MDAMSACLRTYPYHARFSSFEPLLDRPGTGYRESSPSTALRTDTCSPVAFNPA